LCVVNRVSVCCTVAVVVMFGLCWAPFHIQRIMAVYVREEESLTPAWLELQMILFYISGRRGWGGGGWRGGVSSTSQVNNTLSRDLCFL